MKEFLSLVFGDISLAMYLACFLYAAIGAGVYTYAEVSGRNVESVNTPRKFSIKFLLLDNIKRYFLTIILIFLQFRFSKETLGVDLNPYVALSMGFSADGLAGIGKRLTSILKVNRQKLLNQSGT